jgi:hypothetical protein
VVIYWRADKATAIKRGSFASEHAAWEWCQEWLMAAFEVSVWMMPPLPLPELVDA